MAGRKPVGEPMSQKDMIETGKQKRATSKIYKAEADEIKDEAISLSISNALSEIRKSDIRQKIDLEDTATVKSVAETYLESCAISSCFPSMSSLAMALGYTRRYLYTYMERKADSETGKFLIQLHDLFSNIVAENSLRNNANNITAIFILKALFGYKDTQTYELLQNVPSDTTTVSDLAIRAGLLSDD